MKSSHIRTKFIEFFKQHGHTPVASSSLIPAQDPTLLFANAGMNQFKAVFLGKEKRSYRRATSIQKCVRAGGKHNDLDEVGFTPRHLTFFEMMGNFSFGDYFKKDAIQFAWNFLTKELNLPAEKLYVTVYTTDNQTYDIWHNDIGLPEHRISRLGQKDNFWSMGQTGPCGPCTDIYFDSVQSDCTQSTCAPGCDCSRYTEIWGIVFMQYNRQSDGTYKPLLQTSVDAGIGFERLCMIMQNKKSVFEIDIFQDLISTIETLTKHSYTKSDVQQKGVFHVLCDHIRSSSFIIADGGCPSNEGRGYVLRKIIRRGALFAQKLSQNNSLFPALAQEVIKTMSGVYPELKKNESLIISILQNEIERFAHNLEKGQEILDTFLIEKRNAHSSMLDGKQIFRLYDTYGFPLELTRVIAHENNFTLDIDGFEVAMAQQKAQSGKKNTSKKNELPIPEDLHTQFTGYNHLETKSRVTFVYPQKKTVWIVTEESPFYVESGGQVNDKGSVTINNHTYTVLNLKKIGKFNQNCAIAIELELQSPDSLPTLSVGDIAHSVVDAQARSNTARNHSATHLLQAALIHMFGPHIKQAGSVVESDYLRFDYTHHESLTNKQIIAVEKLVNNKIQENIKTEILHTNLKKAQESGVIAFFGEKYNLDHVRVVKIPGFSAELCGGTHVSNTGTIGLFKIISDTALSTGIRRIVALTGPKAVDAYQQSFDTVKTLSQYFKVTPDNIVSATEKLQEQYQKALREIKHLKKEYIKNMTAIWQKKIHTNTRVPYLFLMVQNYTHDELKIICQELEKKTPGFYFLISQQADRPSHVSFIGYVSKKFSSEINLQKLALILREKHRLRGGGSSTLLQGGGTQPCQELEKDILELIQKD